MGASATTIYSCRAAGPRPATKVGSVEPQTWLEAPTSIRASLLSTCTCRGLIQKVPGLWFQLRLWSVGNDRGHCLVLEVSTAAMQVTAQCPTARGLLTEYTAASTSV